MYNIPVLKLASTFSRFTVTIETSTVIMSLAKFRSASGTASFKIPKIDESDSSITTT